MACHCSQVRQQPGGAPLPCHPACPRCLPAAAVNPGYTVVTQHAETKLAATFAACAEQVGVAAGREAAPGGRYRPPHSPCRPQAAKLRFGAMKFVASVFEQLTVVHINGNHVVATVLANPDANLGVVLGVAPQIAESLDSLNHEVAIIRNE